MGSILLDAHGTWDPSSVPAYAMVPKGSRLLFFTENMKLFVGSLSDKAKLPSTEPNLVVESQKSAQNYTVSPFNSGGTLVGDGFEYMTPPKEMLLCTNEACADRGWHKPGTGDDECQGLFADPKFEGVDIYFMACRFVKLNPVGSVDFYADTGVNQRQDGLGDDGSSEVGIALSNDAVDKLISEVLPDPTDYAGLAPDQKQLLKDDLLAQGTDDKTRMVTTRLVERLTERFG